MSLVLGSDCNEQYLEIEKSGDQMYRRAYVRSVFAFIEGILHRMKRTATHFGTAFETLTIAERVAIDGTSFESNDRGEVDSRPVFIKFLNSVKFALRVYSRSTRSSFELSIGGRGLAEIARYCKSQRSTNAP